MKLIITKSIVSSASLAKAIRVLEREFSLSDALQAANNLPYINDNLHYPEESMHVLLDGMCEFSYEKIHYDDEETDEEYPGYKDARDWYHTLSKEDQARVDVLINSNSPRG